MAKLAGHTFLATLGKKRLRPGGIKATQWLLKEAKLNSSLKVLEVACNMGTTSIEMTKKYNLNLTSCDIDKNALEIAKANAKKKKVSHKINFVYADALNLPFEDESFDVVINEAMLTMQNDKNKEKAISEYYRVLKKGGMLLTHDVCLTKDDETFNKEIKANLSRAINVHVEPLTVSKWTETFEKQNFDKVTEINGPMSLMKPTGMIKDEGFINTFRIIKRALKKENKTQFFTMFKTFKKYKKELGYIAVASIK
ncbi:methyltransferase [Alteracholeplasma palmae J233]|uniref:Methyltransferase n=1 Tax=Alteracholeplasma palmae (strain ATCC 49389 / J233) TaxID=1318466 RepID=U4KLT3_ALTPJ|nr:class I SAM-dependent methyltransferase [Alteracholeplasma palmae]CCV64944.1 methyltransferase [Alteracholeplasma palmae J233]